MYPFANACDEFVVSSRLLLKLEMDPSRESLLHFFEQIRRGFPTMRQFRRRDDGSVVLETEGDEGPRRSLRIEPFALRFAAHNPESSDAVRELGRLVLSYAPAHLSLSELNYDYLEVSHAFDLEYRGNHDELIAETLFGDHPLLHVLAVGAQKVIDSQPMIGVALTHDCRMQAYLDIKSRTTTLEVRTGEYEPSAVTVNLLVRRYWALDAGNDLLETHAELLTLGESLARERVLPQIVQPLAAAIASRR